VTGNSSLVATNIGTVSRGGTFTFTNRPYSLSLYILDSDSQKYGKLTFSGVFNGTLDFDSAHITNTFTGPQIQSVVIGNHLYTVQIGSFTPPGPPQNYMNAFGSIGAQATVTTIDGGDHNSPPGMATPEPSTLVLSGLCLSLCGAGWWWRRARSLALDLA
jgi:hypothetical protein